MSVGADGPGTQVLPAGCTEQALKPSWGVTREGAKLRVKPCIPADWPGFEVSIQIGQTRYDIKVSRGLALDSTLPAGVEMVAAGEFLIALTDDGNVHEIGLPLTKEPRPL